MARTNSTSSPPQNDQLPPSPPAGSTNVACECVCPVAAPAPPPPFISADAWKGGFVGAGLTLGLFVVVVLVRRWILDRLEARVTAHANTKSSRRGAPSAGVARRRRTRAAARRAGGKKVPDHSHVIDIRDDPADGGRGRKKVARHFSDEDEEDLAAAARCARAGACFLFGGGGFKKEESLKKLENKYPLGLAPHKTDHTKSFNIWSDIAKNCNNVSYLREAIDALTNDRQEPNSMKTSTPTLPAVLVKIGNISIRKDTIDRLADPEEYLNDEIIDASVAILQANNKDDARKDGKVFVEDTHTCEILHKLGKFKYMMDGIEKEEHRQRGLKYLKHDMIFLPINRNRNHWYLAVINTKKQEIQVLDSLGKPRNKRKELTYMLEGIEQCLYLASDEVHTASWLAYNVSSWNVSEIKNIPQQKDGSSCGLFLIKYIEYWTGENLTRLFEQPEIDIFRSEIGTQLITDPLNKMGKEMAIHEIAGNEKGSKADHSKKNPHMQQQQQPDQASNASSMVMQQNITSVSDDFTQGISQQRQLNMNLNETAVQIEEMQGPQCTSPMTMTVQQVTENNNVTATHSSNAPGQLIGPMALSLAVPAQATDNSVKLIPMLMLNKLQQLLNSNQVTVQTTTDFSDGNPTMVHIKLSLADDTSLPLALPGKEASAVAPVNNQFMTLEMPGQVTHEAPTFTINNHLMRKMYIRRWLNKEAVMSAIPVFPDVEPEFITSARTPVRNVISKKCVSNQTQASDELLRRSKRAKDILISDQGCIHGPNHTEQGKEQEPVQQEGGRGEVEVTPELLLAIRTEDQEEEAGSITTNQTVTHG